MEDVIDYLFGAASFMPHGYCLLWRPDLVAMHALSDLVIALSYFSIPVAMVYFLRRRNDLAHRTVFLLSAAFILACGMTHLIGLVTLWIPAYGAQGLAKVATALVSAATAVAVWPVIPRALALPSAGALQAANADLQAARDELERRVEERTLDLQEANARLIRQRDHFRTLYHRAPVMVQSTDATGRLAEVSDRWLDVMGYARGDVTGRPIGDFIDDATPVADVLAEGVATLGLRRRDGGVFEAEVASVPHYDEETGAPTVFTVITDVTERNAARRALEERASDLVTANDSLRQFAYVASHDLQEPLRKIATYADVLLASLDDGDEEETRHAAGVMHRSAVRARKLVADLLDFARTQHRALAMAPLDPAALVEEALQAFSGAISESAAAVSVDVEPAQIRGDPVFAARIVENLLSNALKFHKPDAAPTIRIEGRRGADGSYRLTVADDGVGFDAGSPDLYEPFRRMHTAGSFKGSGIGLAIVKAAITRLGWQVSAQSAPGAGARLTVTMPAAAARRG